MATRAFVPFFGASALLAVAILLLVLPYFQGAEAGDGDSGKTVISMAVAPSSSRRFLRQADESQDQPDRYWGNSRCTSSDIIIDQGQTKPLPSGIPTYTVDIINACDSGCDISQIHLNCGWFSSASQINPSVFKRLRYNDCLVNDGRVLRSGSSIAFQYANTYPYPLSVSSVHCP